MIGGDGSFRGALKIARVVAERGAKIALDRYPRAVFALMRLPVTWRVLDGLVLGEVSHPGEARGAGLKAMQVIRGLARLAGSPHMAPA